MSSHTENTTHDSMSWRKTLLKHDADLREAIVCLNESSLKVVIIVDANGRLLGTLSDGDIRRGLLRGLDLSSSVGQIIQRDPLVVPPQWGKKMVMQLMQANKIHQIPVVDEAKKVVGLHLWDDLQIPLHRSNLMVIMAGGRGSRLGVETDNCPKPLLSVGGKPMLEHIIEHAKSEGFSQFVLSTHYLGHMIEDYFGDGNKWQVHIDYIREKTALGTAGALGLMERQPEEPFLVTNGDVLTDIKYGEVLDFHMKHEASATMAVRIHEWQHPFGVVKTRGVDIIGFEEKPIATSHVNAGIYVLNQQVLGRLAKGEHCDMPDLFQGIAESSERTIAYPMHEPWLDVGRPPDLELARKNHIESTNSN